MPYYFITTQSQSVANGYYFFNPYTDPTIEEAPDFIGGLSLSDIRTTSLNLTYTMDKLSNVFFMIVRSTATPPTQEQIKIGTDYGNETVLYSLSQSSVLADVENTIQIENLINLKGVDLTVYATANAITGNPQEASNIASALFTLKIGVLNYLDLFWQINTIQAAFNPERMMVIKPSSRIMTIKA